LNSVDISSLAPADQTQPAADLFLIFVGANIVATTFQIGASLASSFSIAMAFAIIAAGSVAGAALVGILAPLGSRLRVPSLIATRAALGIRGAGLVAVLLYVSNFAWIALNNVIAASACARVAGGSTRAWAIGLGLAATAIVWAGPRAVARADRVAVPLLLITSIALTVACLRTTAIQTSARVAAPMTWWTGVDVVIAYQVSWILMFADYSRYTASPRASGAAVFIALAATSIWMMPLGVVAAQAAGTADPGAMIAAVGLGATGALLLTLATLTTNFVNIYMSALAWKTLVPRTGDAAIVWSIGLVGAALSAAPDVWLDQYANFMVGLGAALVPIGGVLIAHYYLAPTRHDDDALVRDLYDERGRFRGVSAAGTIAWSAGAGAYFVARSIGGTIPGLIVSIAAYSLLRRWR
jgi:purine-cytosine permease-like protein